MPRAATFLEETDDASVIPLGEVATSGSPLPPAVCEITEVVDKPGPSSTLGMLRGTIEQYRRLLDRVGA